MTIRTNKNGTRNLTDLRREAKSVTTARISPLAGNWILSVYDAEMRLWRHQPLGHACDERQGLEILLGLI